MKSNLQNSYALNKYSESTEFDTIYSNFDLKSELMLEHVSKILVGSIAAIVLVAGLSTEANATLVYRDKYVSQGYGLVYDSGQNITWTQFAVAGYSQSLSQAFAIVNIANSGGYYSLTGWRLPSETELLTLYGELPGIYGSDKVGTVQFGSGPNDHFSNIQPIYWSNHPPFLDTGIEVAFQSLPGIFEPPAGTSRYVDTYYQNTVWLVRDGDVGTTTITYALVVTKTGTGTGTVTSSPVGISCGATCSYSYNSGTTVTLTSTPGASSTFTGWSGGGCFGTSTCVVTLIAANSVTATFTLSAPAAARVPALPAWALLLMATAIICIGNVIHRTLRR